MKNFLKNHGLWVLFVAAVISVLMALMSYFSAASTILTDAVNIVASPFRAVYTVIGTWFVDKQNYYLDNKALQEENASLKQQIAQMEATVRQAEDALAENEKFRKLINLREQRRDITNDLEAALITEHEVSNWTNSLTLNKGTLQGVEAGDCVIDETGALVGLVSEVGTNWCTVLNIVDTDVSLGAQVFRTKDLGVAEGNFSLMRENRLRMSYLPANCQLLAGDLVVTSGLGQDYPSGLVIGTIEEVKPDASGAASYAVLLPKVNFDSLTEVFIIKSFEIVM